MAKKTYNDVMKEFTEGGGMEAAGSVVGDVVGLIGSDAKYKGAQTGKTIGGGIGTGLGALIGMPGVGQMVGSAIGGLIGGKSDKENMINDYEDVQKKKYSRLDLAANVNPYGGDNTLYMAEGGMIDFTDPGGGGRTAKKRIYNTQAEVDTANRTAQRIAKKNYHVNASNVTVGRGVGDPVVPFVNENGMDITGAMDLFGTKPLATKIPQGAQIQSQQGQYWYEDQHTGDVIDLDPSVVNLKQFQKPAEEVMADKVQRSLATRKITPSFKKGGIHIKPQNRGKFTQWANNHGMGVQEAASHVMSNKDDYSGTVVKRANFAKNFGGKKAGGGMSDQPEMERSMVNVEKGELLIDPITLEVVRDYDNPNRYKEHSKKSMFEPVGNFTMINQGQVVIPKKFAKRFKYGDELARKSIVAEILKNQANEGTEYTGSVPMAADGMIMDNRPPRVTGGPMEMLDMWNAYDPATAQLPGGFNSDTPANTFGRSFFNGDTPMTAGMPGDFGNASPAAVLNPGSIGGGWQTNDRTPAGKPGAGLNKNLLSAKIMGAIPTAYGITNALGTDPFLRYDENTQFDSAKSYIQDMETSPNIESAKAAIRRTNAGRNQILNNFNSPATRSEVAANNVAGLKAEGDLIQNASNVSMDARNRKRQTLASLEEQQGQGRLNMRQQLMNELRMDKANRENLVHQGLSEAATNYNTGVMDQERIKALNTMANYYQLTPYAASLLEDQGEYMNRIMEGLGGLKGTPGIRPVGAGKRTDVSSTTRDRVGNVKQTKDTKIIRR